MDGDFQGDNIVVQLFLDTVKFVSVRDALSCSDMHCHNIFSALGKRSQNPY